MTYLPSTRHDAGALLELNLAEELRERCPDFDVTRVDLSGFQPLRPKIDCMTISCREGISRDEIELLRQKMKGSLNRPNDRPREVTIHDPSTADLKYLLQNYPAARIEYLELAVDALLPDGSNDLYLLRQLKEQLRHCLAPQEHEIFTNAKRVYWDIPRNRWLHDAVKNPAPLTTVRYFGGKYKGRPSLKLYIKTLDQKSAVGKYFVRTELSLDSAALDWAGVGCVEDLPRFALTLRKYCAKMFFIGNGFKNGDDDGEKWRKYGAGWTLSGTKGLHIQADAEANVKFGGALNNLGRSLQRMAAVLSDSE